MKNKKIGDDDILKEAAKILENGNDDDDLINILDTEMKKLLGTDGYKNLENFSHPIMILIQNLKKMIEVQVFRPLLEKKEFSQIKKGVINDLEMLTKHIIKYFNDLKE